MTSIKKIIQSNGAILSGDIIKALQKAEPGLKKPAARQRISRFEDDGIYRIRHFFKDGQILFHDKEIFGKSEYFDALRRAFKEAGKQYYVFIQSLDFHYGHIHSDQMANYSVNPIENLKGHLSFEDAKSNLKNLNLIKEEGNYVSLNNSLSEFEFNRKRSKGVEVAKHFLLVQFNDWVRKIGLASWSSSKFNSEFAKYQFAYVNSSYVASLTEKTNTKTKPAFVVADILIGNSITVRQVNFFVNKIEAIQSQKNHSKFIPFLIVDSIDPDSLNKLKAKGVVIGFVNQLFGDEYKELLESLINLVTNAGAILKKNPDAYLKLISKLNKLVKGKTHNLRGDLFELAVGYYQGKICNSIEIGKIILHDGDQREIDVFGLKSNSIIIAECKGYKSQISRDLIEVWLIKKIPVIREWVLSQSSIADRNLTFEYWSTGGFTDEAIQLLDKTKESVSPNKFRIEYYDLDEMINISKSVKSEKFTEILAKYYEEEI